MDTIFHKVSRLHLDKWEWIMLRNLCEILIYFVGFALNYFYKGLTADATMR